MFVMAPSVSGWAPLEVLSERRLDITGSGFGTLPRVRLLDLQGIYSLPNLYSGATDSSLAVAMPTVRAAETHPDYARNTLQLTLRAVVMDQDAEPPVQSEPFEIRLVLPPPSAGAAVAAGSELYVGRIAGRSDLPVVGDTEWVGGPERGEVRTYGDDISGVVTPLRSQVMDLMGSASSLDDAALLLDRLRQLRMAGERLEVAYWHEEGILARLPRSGGATCVVVWRDDLPSEAQPIVIAGRIGLSFELVRR